jgi:hypothetical protein
MTDNTTMIKTETMSEVAARTTIDEAAQQLQRVLDEQTHADPGHGAMTADARRMALLTAVRHVEDAFDAPTDHSNGASYDARRRMVRESLHVLGADELRSVRRAVLSGHRCTWLQELSFNAMQRGELKRAIAAEALLSAGEKALSRAMVVRAGFGFMWHSDPDEIIRTQRCSSHNVFCCPACPDEPTAPIAPIRVAVRGRPADTGDLVEQRRLPR